MKLDIIKKIEKIIGKKNIVQSEIDKKKYLTEWRNRYTGEAKAILKPKNVQEVSSLMKIFNKEKIAVVPQGGNTGLVGGQISYNDQHFIISFERMNKLIKFNKEDQSMVVQSGMLLSDIQNICDENDMYFPLSLASEGSCTIGGNIATNAGGVAVLYFGNTRELTLGLQIVLADGTIIDSLKTLKKDNTGYSLKDLFIGSEGTLGLITAASMKVFFKPREKYTFFCSIKDPQKSIELLRFFQKNIPTPLTAFELMNSNSIETVLNHFEKTNLPLNKKSDWYILFEFSSFEQDKSRINKVLKIINQVSQSKTLFYTKCGSGTYIRSLAEDMAKSLNTFAVVSSLRRVGLGNLDKKLISLDYLLSLVHIEGHLSILRPIEKVFNEFNQIHLDLNEVALILDGRPIEMNEIKNKINDFCGKLTLAKFKNKLVAVGYLKDGNFYPKNLLNNFFV